MAGGRRLRNGRRCGNNLEQIGLACFNRTVVNDDALPGTEDQASGGAHALRADGSVGYFNENMDHWIR